MEDIEEDRREEEEEGIIIEEIEEEEDMQQIGNMMYVQISAYSFEFKLPFQNRRVQ